MPMDVGQAITAALKLVGQSFVIDAQQVHDRGVQVVDVQAVEAMLYPNSQVSP